MDSGGKGRNKVSILEGKEERSGWREGWVGGRTFIVVFFLQEVRFSEDGDPGAG